MSLLERHEASIEIPHLEKNPEKKIEESAQKFETTKENDLVVESFKKIFLDQSVVYTKNIKEKKTLEIEMVHDEKSENKKMTETWHFQKLKSKLNFEEYRKSRKASK